MLRPVCLGICALPSVLEGYAWRTMESGLTPVRKRKHVMHSAEMKGGGRVWRTPPVGKPGLSMIGRTYEGEYVSLRTERAWVQGP